VDALIPGVLHVRQLGRQPFMATWPAMEAYCEARGEHGADELWLLEHDPVFTLGQAGRPEHVLAPGDIPVVRTNRGGQVTYHGPGQIVAYPLIDTLASWEIRAERREGAPGVYVGGAKIGALGLRVRRGCSFHGLAFNVNLDPEPFSRINPCGYQGLQVTSVLECGGPATLADVEPVLVHHLAAQLGLQPEFVPGLPPALVAAA
jgi:lipoyl(octanoyl) transferase